MDVLIVALLFITLALLASIWARLGEIIVGLEIDRRVAKLRHDNSSLPHHVEP